MRLTDEIVERAARALYEENPIVCSGESVDGFQAVAGGLLSWEAAARWDEEFAHEEGANILNQYRRDAEVVLRAVESSVVDDHERSLSVAILNERSRVRSAIYAAANESIIFLEKSAAESNDQLEIYVARSFVAHIRRFCDTAAKSVGSSPSGAVRSE